LFQNIKEMVKNEKEKNKDKEKNPACIKLAILHAT
jgi:hypothetical protein